VTDIRHGTFDAALQVADRWAMLPAPETVGLLANVVQAYALFADAGRQAQLAELFTADATWDGTSLGYGTASGAPDIAAHVCGHHRADEPMMHLPGPPLLSAVTDDEIQGVTWCMATRWADGALRPVIYFYYEDTFHRADDATWRFHRRHLHAAFPG
jgi:hypothetical protein